MTGGLTVIKGWAYIMEKQGFFNKYIPPSSFVSGPASAKSAVFSAQLHQIYVCLKYKI